MKKLFAALGAAAATASSALLLAVPAHAEPVNRCDLVDMRTAIAGGHTSCAFAHNVRVAWFTQPGNPVFACSPDTGGCYQMMCVYNPVERITFDDNTVVTGPTRCVDYNGGSAVVWVW